jgi:hypothetical protein
VFDRLVDSCSWESNGYYELTVGNPNIALRVSEIIEETIHASGLTEAVSIGHDTLEKEKSDEDAEEDIIEMFRSRKLVKVYPANH